MVSFFRKKPGAFFRLAAITLAMCISSSLPAIAQDGAVEVMTDRAKVFRIDAPADTVIVGNPAIADVTMYDRQTVVVTGKLYGTTNLVILDKKGEPIIDEVIRVSTSGNDVVTVMRNTSRTTYSCAPDCEPVLRVGDNADAFEAQTKQATSRNDMSEKAAGVTN
ncbi:pilus assembly protein N-terminal domain-containing protein [Stappia indica]|uniref:pilus assembly protein N-terminal domain-containing protein n=1 Tax=Stappia indica TaxID=538381 RepID=UPI001CD1CE69|nr:pilus assembly protein N-terminal domain-containing protein [Stappia indica]MCA1300798.1 pilus assembly protein N-terminal domain-containing protein [Stappia indica]